MFNITLPPPGLNRKRGRPKQIKTEGGTPELLRKQRRIRDIISDSKPCVVLSWLHIAHHDKTINQDLFHLGSRYLRFRIQVLRHQQNRLLKLNCSVLTKHLGRSISKDQEEEDAKAEEIWQDLSQALPSSIIHCLDELLLGDMNYDLTADQITYYKRQLKASLLILDNYKDVF